MTSSRTGQIGTKRGLTKKDFAFRLKPVKGGLRLKWITESYFGYWEPSLPLIILHSGPSAPLALVHQDIQDRKGGSLYLGDSHKPVSPLPYTTFKIVLVKPTQNSYLTF